MDARTNRLTITTPSDHEIVLTRLPRLLTHPDRAKAERALQAMFTMQKIDVAELERAFAA